MIGDGNDALRPVDSDSLSLGGLDEVDSEENLSDGDTDPDYREVQQARLRNICCDLQGAHGGFALGFVKLRFGTYPLCSLPIPYHLSDPFSIGKTEEQNKPDQSQQNLV